MDNYIRTYDSVIDKTSCQLLVDKFEKYYEDQHEDVLVERPGMVIAFKQINIWNYDEWKGLREQLIEAMLYYVDIYKEECNVTDVMWPENFSHEAIRIKRYLPNDFERFDNHVDSTAGCEKRFLNFLIYLNDVEEGGETEFPQIMNPKTNTPLSVKPKAGTMAVFPPMWCWLHAGKKPISGPKYFAHSYLHYKTG